MNDDFDWSDRSLHKETRSDEWIKYNPLKEMSSFHTKPGTVPSGWKRSQNVPTSNPEPGTYILNSTEKMEGVHIMNDNYRPENLLHDSRDDAEFINEVNADNKNLIGRLSMESIENNLLKSVLNSETQFCKECVSKGTKLGIQIVIQSNSLQNQKKFENFEASIQRNVQTMDRLVKACEVCLLNMPDAI